jgi:predicted nucleic acid-binding protein
VILDTNAVSALLAGDRALREILEPEDRHHLPVIVIGEYRYGLLRSTHRRRLEAVFNILLRESLVLDVDPDTADSYARVRESLRRAGHPIPENDVWIAALAARHDLPVVSRDVHFDAIPGVRRIGW